MKSINDIEVLSCLCTGHQCSGGVSSYCKMMQCSLLILNPYNLICSQLWSTFKAKAQQSK